LFLTILFFCFALHRILQEVAVLLEALERRQLELENENKQLKNDLAEAVQLIEDAEEARLLLEKQLSERVANS
jgi:hypothetical protein